MGGNLFGPTGSISNDASRALYMEMMGFKMWGFFTEVKWASGMMLPQHFCSMSIQIASLTVCWNCCRVGLQVFTRTIKLSCILVEATSQAGPEIRARTFSRCPIVCRRSPLSSVMGSMFNPSETWLANL